MWGSRSAVGSAARAGWALLVALSGAEALSACATLPPAERGVAAARAQGYGEAERPQQVAYRIEARLDEASDILTGRLVLEYTNRAGVPLDTLWFHQHLNAFRPNSAFARREMQFASTRFQLLGADDHGFERLGRVAVDGVELRPFYPGAPDSTVVGIPLPASLASGASLSIEMDWTARLATIPRRQGRSGRHFDWAHWYPRIAAFKDGRWETQALVPQGEFFGEFASYDVVLEVAQDQVLGATGVPVDGDPGWAGSARTTAPIVYNRDAYPATSFQPLGLLGAQAAEGMKRIRWRAEDVHHFAWAMDPTFVYEGGSFSRADGGGEVGIHVLFVPNDVDWGNGMALGRTITALEWLEDRFGPYLWPQLTNLRRIESGGTEFPMMMMNGSPSEGLILHEATHQYLHGMLASNEFREGWLDEGFTSYITNRYFEEQGVDDIWEPSLAAARERERFGATQPVALPGAEFRDQSMYSAMTYTKPELIFRMLEWLIGEEAMRSVLRTYFEQNALQHVDETDFRRAVSEVTGESYDAFFDQWIHSTARLDYSVESATTEQRSDGRWLTRVRIRREGAAWMPVTLQVGDTSVRLEGREPLQVVEITTDARPSEARLDPEDVLLDMQPANNVRRIDG